MPAKQVPDWPVRGTPGGYHDVWDDPDPAATARDQAARVVRATDPLVATWRAESAHRAARTEAKAAQVPAGDAPAASPDGSRVTRSRTVAPTRSLNDSPGPGRRIGQPQRHWSSQLPPFVR